MANYSLAKKTKIQLAKLILPSIILLGSPLLTGCQATQPNMNIGGVSTVNNGQQMTVNADTLLKYHWKLVQVTASNGAAVEQVDRFKDKARLKFIQKASAPTANDMRISYEIGCNTFGSGATLNPNTQSLTTGMPMSTRQYCASLAAAENQFSSLMMGTSKLSLSSSNGGTSVVLKQVTSNQGTLIWQGSMAN